VTNEIGLFVVFLIFIVLSVEMGLKRGKKGGAFPLNEMGSFMNF
jgi:hypothetical protein